MLNESARSTESQRSLLSLQSLSYSLSLLSLMSLLSLLTIYLTEVICNEILIGTIKVPYYDRPWATPKKFNVPIYIIALHCIAFHIYFFNPHVEFVIFFLNIQHIIHNHNITYNHVLQIVEKQDPED